MQGQQQSAQAKAQASALRQNALYLNNAANDAKVRGAIESDQARVQTQQLIGTQRAAQAANGGLVNEGSNAIIQQETAQLGELDALTISNNAAREAYGYQVEASNALSNAKQLSKIAKRSPFTSLLGGVIQGAAGAYGSGLFSSTGSGTAAALSGASRLNNNQAYT
jgi:hypothetical protein